ncbi:DUF3857 domain-containing protein [Lewinella sp. 4G2]|uniref:transglutaminase domain-containing protein n=1 Tax=Lewinella sp. 4G2 TaxID=1803372 RepID=UPI0007B4E62F|nr:DUF3857 domain-containing protein [Lewinella sp. 4G2]OAV45201.1 hypothetical protein A3850_012170 [Lewinella sp. 4G2]
MKHLNLFLLLLLITTGLCAQDREPLDIKYGKLSAGEFSYMPTGRDSSTEAYVLFDRMSLEINFDASNTPRRTQRVHRRVKLIRESSFDRATVELYYRPKTESMTDINACIFIPGEKVVKLKGRDFVRSKYSDDVNLIKFTFPGVKEGAIIEYQYNYSTENIVVPSRFQFQEDIPVRYVEYSSRILDMFEYVNIGTSTNYDVKQHRNTTQQLGSRTHQININTFGYYDLPSYEYQPYVNNFLDYLPYVQYQLRNFYPPDGTVRKIFTDWPQTIKAMDGWTEFGKAYKQGGLSNGVWKVAEPKLAGLTTETEKAQALYDFVINNVVWNEVHDWTSDHSPDRTFEAKEGDSGEMAFMLLALLRRADIEAQPALVSLRDRGAPIQVFPIMAQFEHAMVYAKLDGEWTFLDPNDRRRPMGLPRSSALNGAVMIADPDNPRWVEPTTPAAKSTIMVTADLQDDGTATTEIIAKSDSYFAYSDRIRVANMEEDMEFPIAENIAKRFPEASLVDMEVMDGDVKSGDMKYSMHLEVPMADVVDDYLYLQPILVTALDKELVDTERRLYPMDFNYPWVKRYITTINLPEGYVVDEIPESFIVKSEDGSMVSLFRVLGQEDGKINLEHRVSINRTVYSAAEYPVLKELFELVIEAQESVIVLKKAK